MVVLEHDAIEIDYCVGCHGIWLDAGELELLFGETGGHEAFLRGGDPAQVRHEKPRRCPICRKKMGKVVTRTEPSVVYDRCARGDGLWFDRGELHEILRHGVAPEGGERVARFLAEVFPAPKG
jgi:hypothetical protein